MGNFALYLGSTACKIGTQLPCADSTSTMLVGYSLLVAVGMVLAGWATARA